MDDLEYKIGRLALAPGDILVVKVKRIISKAIADYIRERMAAIVGTPNKVMVIDEEIDLAVLTRAEIEARADGGAA